MEVAAALGVEGITDEARVLRLAVGVGAPFPFSLVLRVDLAGRAESDSSPSVSWVVEGKAPGGLVLVVVGVDDLMESELLGRSSASELTALLLSVKVVRCWEEKVRRLVPAIVEGCSRLEGGVGELARSAAAIVAEIFGSRTARKEKGLVSSWMREASISKSIESSSIKVSLFRAGVKLEMEDWVRILPKPERVGRLSDIAGEEIRGLLEPT